MAEARATAAHLEDPRQPVRRLFQRRRLQASSGTPPMHGLCWTPRSAASHNAAAFVGAVGGENACSTRSVPGTAGGHDLFTLSCLPCRLRPESACARAQQSAICRSNAPPRWSATFRYLSCIMRTAAKLQTAQRRAVSSAWMMECLVSACPLMTSTRSVAAGPWCPLGACECVGNLHRCSWQHVVGVSCPPPGMAAKPELCPRCKLRPFHHLCTVAGTRPDGMSEAQDLPDEHGNLKSGDGPRMCWICASADPGFACQMRHLQQGSQQAVMSGERLASTLPCSKSFDLL